MNSESEAKNLVPPEPILVEAGKAVDDYWNGQGEAEHSGQGTKSRKHLILHIMT